MAKLTKSYLNRRRFLKTAALTGAASVLSRVNPAVGDTPSMARPQQIEGSSASETEVMTTDRPGADFMMDILKSHKTEYMSAATRVRATEVFAINSALTMEVT